MGDGGWEMGDGRKQKPHPAAPTPTAQLPPLAPKAIPAEALVGSAESIPAVAEETHAGVERTLARAEENPADDERTPARGERSPARVEESPANGERTPARVEDDPVFFRVFLQC